MNNFELVIRNLSKQITLTIIWNEAPRWQFVISYGDAIYDSGLLKSLPSSFLLGLTEMANHEEGDYVRADLVADLVAGSLDMSIRPTVNQMYSLSFGLPSSTSRRSSFRLSYDELKTLYGFLKT